MGVIFEKIDMNEQMNRLFERLDFASNAEEILAIQKDFAEIGWIFLGDRDNYNLTPLVSESAEPVEL